MEKEKLGVIFGGRSTENEVSIVSAKSVLKNLPREKYEIYPIYIDKEGLYWKYIEEKDEKNEFGQEIEKKEKIENIVEYLKNMDVIFPVLHGLYGEDGTIQGLFELLQIPYVGCKVLASSVGMDKVYTKIIFEKAGLKQAKYESIRKHESGYYYVDKYLTEQKMSLSGIIEIVARKLKISYVYKTFKFRF